MSRVKGSSRKVTGARKRDTTRTRVSEIVRIMSEGLWKSGVTDVELRNKWGIKKDRMNQLCAEASRRISDAVEADGGDAIRATVIAAIEGVRVAAINGKNLRAAIDALELQARIHGLLVHKTEAKVQMAKLEGLTDAELAEQLEAEAARLRERAKEGES